MHDIPLLINLTLAVIVAFIGGIIAKRLGLPTIVGYLIGGVVIGPFTPGFVGDLNTLQQLAELGVIFLMFGVGLHFSFDDLWHVRDIAIPGALIQTGLATLLGFGISQLWGWSIPAGIVLGLTISVASTVVLLRGLMDNSLLNTPHGQAAVGWLVMEDILSVLILVLMPILTASADPTSWQGLGWAFLKAGIFVAIMFFGGVRAIPWLLEKVAHNRSRELFILAILAVTLGTAMGASELFGVSLALGAFIAGAIVNRSHLSHQIGIDVSSFRETFSVLFFVSIGMLVNPIFLWKNIGYVALLTTLVVLGKTLIVIALGFFFPRPARTFLVVALGLSQIGEFSFILGQGAVSLGIMDTSQYSLILATSIFSIAVNPFMYRLLPVLERFLQKMPGVWQKLEANIPLKPVNTDELENHVVIVGFGRVGKHLVDVLQQLEVPILVVESDAVSIAALTKNQIPTLYGDAGNSEILIHANLKKASALVVTVPDETTAELVVATSRDLNPDLPIIARAETGEGVAELARFGANHVVHPELEGGLELIHYTLLDLGFPLREVHEYSDAVRRDAYNVDITSAEEHRTLHDLMTASELIDVVWLQLCEESPIVGRSLLDVNIRAQTGASIVALIRNKKLISNPKSVTVFEERDRIGLIGEKLQIDAVRRLIEPEDHLCDSDQAF
jgi:CPA2 family monovalent cation:H+ antiporter-2